MSQPSNSGMAVDQPQERRKTVAIISSYNVTCGIAYNTERIQHHLKRYYDVKVVVADMELLRMSSSPALKIAGDRHMDALARQLDGCDYVNIQMEAGVFGKFYHHSWPRLCRLLPKIRQPILMTMHCSPIVHATDLRSFVTTLLKNPIRGLPAFLYRLMENSYHRKFWNLCGELMKKGQLSMVAYNKREKFRFNAYFGYSKVADHPLCYFDQEERNKYQTIDQINFREKLGLASGDIIVGAYGFVSAYKGFIDGIRVLAHLPQHFKFVVFGGANINSLVAGSDVDPALFSLIELVRSMGLENRVLFTGALTDDEMCYATAQADIVLLPYLDTEQVASGPASLAVELADKIIATDCFTFNRYLDYYPNRMKKYDSGNILHLSQLIREMAAQPKHAVAYPALNIETQSRLYRDIFENEFTFTSADI